MFSLLCVMTYLGANAYYDLIHRDENFLSSFIDQSDDTIHLLRDMHKATKYPVVSVTAIQSQLMKP